MRIAIPKDGEMVNQHFGQSRNFLIASVENQQIVNRKEISSESLQHNHAGLAGLLIKEGVSMIIAGGIGQPAANALEEKGIEVIKGASGKCEEVLETYLAGNLKDQNVTCNHHGEHHHQ
ncbi:MAG: NifB/NifX family molybdenum-iron cluster-binding protein [Syntrophomonas sp.]|nr:NifB/NifX family molybdenum-iron cluster-binding protein [Syntrophomonas sp.]